MERRRYLRTITAAGVGTLLAGCSEGEDGEAGPTAGTDGPAGPSDSPEPTDPIDPPGDRNATATADPTPTGTIPEVPVADSMTGWERRSYHPVGTDADDPPSVDFDVENDRLFVRGFIVIGSSSCKEATVEEIAYVDGELYVYVVHDWKESVSEETPRVCTADLSQETYEIEVTFDDGLPARVVAEERDYYADERRTVYER